MEIFAFLFSRYNLKKKVIPNAATEPNPIPSEAIKTGALKFPNAIDPGYSFMKVLIIKGSMRE